jgi:hypothetical protein
LIIAGKVAAVAAFIAEDEHLSLVDAWSKKAPNCGIMVLWLCTKNTWQHNGEFFFFVFSGFPSKTSLVAIQERKAECVVSG